MNLYFYCFLLNLSVIINRLYVELKSGVGHLAIPWLLGLPLSHFYVFLKPFLVFTHLTTRPCWRSTNMAAVTSGANQQLLI